MISQFLKDFIITKSYKENASLRPEIELILCCARIRIDPATAHQIHTLLHKDLDWNYLLEKASQQGVSILVYQSLQKTHPELIPKNIVHQLQAYSQINIARNLLLTKELLEILDLLATHNIIAIPFKGPILATLAYGNMALREFCDLDILVSKEDFLQAKKLLICRGYQHKYLAEHEAAYAQAQMIRPDGKGAIDLHYEIAPKSFFFPLDSQPFWQRLQSVSIAGKPVATLSPEDSILVAYIHGSKEGWTSLKRICDMAELIYVYSKINWDQIIEQVSFLGNEQSFFFSLLIVSQHLKTSLPKEIYQKVEKLPKLQFLAKEYFKWILSEAQVQKQSTRMGAVYFFQIAMIDNLGGRLKYALKLALKVNEKDRAIYPLPPFLSFLYYPVRLFRLLVTYQIGKEKLFMYKDS